MNRRNHTGNLRAADGGASEYMPLSKSPVGERAAVEAARCVIGRFVVDADEARKFEQMLGIAPQEIKE